MHEVVIDKPIISKLMVNFLLLQKISIPVPCKAAWRWLTGNSSHAVQGVCVIGLHDWISNNVITSKL